MASCILNEALHCAPRRHVGLIDCFVVSQALTLFWSLFELGTVFVFVAVLLVAVTLVFLRRLLSQVWPTRLIQIGR